jgi:hypothetical protein
VCSLLGDFALEPQQFMGFQDDLYEDSNLFPREQHGKKMLVRQASPLVDACEGSCYAKFSAAVIYFLQTHGSYCYCTCDLNILGTRMEVSFLLF